MRPFTRMLLIAALLLLPASSLRAQTAVDPSGHWEGAVHAPNMEVKIEIDLAKNSKGELAGTFSGRDVKGLPLARVVVEGKSISFHAREDQTFKGTISADGTSMSGELTGTDPTGKAFSVPFSLTRTGDARIEPPAKSAPIGKELEGTWNGTLEVQGKQLRLVLKMANQSDFTSTGSIVTLDQGALEVPVAITQKGSSVSLDAKVIGGSFSGTLNPEGTELAGTWTQGALVLPLTFRRAK